jgi:hypothetical protein
MGAACALLLLVGLPAQASYICTGAGGSASSEDPYYDNDLSDTRCDITEVEAFLGITIDEDLIMGSKTNSVEVDPDPGEPYIGSWVQDEFGLGTLVVTTWEPDTSDDEGLNSGTWELTGGTEPLFWVEKYNGGYDIYSYMGGNTSPFSDNWDIADAVRGTAGASCSELNCNAFTSHISVYGVVPVPPAVWLFGSGLLGLIGIARRKSA